MTIINTPCPPQQMTKLVHSGNGVAHVEIHNGDVGPSWVQLYKAPVGKQPDPGDAPALKQELLMIPGGFRRVTVEVMAVEGLWIYVKDPGGPQIICTGAA